MAKPTPFDTLVAASAAHAMLLPLRGAAAEAQRHPGDRATWALLQAIDRAAEAADESPLDTWTGSLPGMAVELARAAKLAADTFRAVDIRDPKLGELESLVGKAVANALIVLELLEDLRDTPPPAPPPAPLN